MTRDLRPPPEQALGRPELRALADRLLAPVPDADAIEACVAFVAAETLLVGHGRARARMSRRLKHCRLSDDQRERLLGAILRRLYSGRFAQQFKDQLRLALALEPARVREAALRCTRAEAEHVCRHARWILTRDRHLRT